MPKTDSVKVFIIDIMTVKCLKPLNDNYGKLLVISLFDIIFKCKNQNLNSDHVKNGIAPPKCWRPTEGPPQSSSCCLGTTHLSSVNLEEEIKCLLGLGQGSFMVSHLQKPQPKTHQPHPDATYPSPHSYLFPSCL